MSTTFSRLSLIVLTLAASLFVAAPAQASTAPGTWEKAPESSLLEILAIFVGGPAVLFGLCVLIGLLTARNNYVPPAPKNEIVPASRGDVVHH